MVSIENEFLTDLVRAKSWVCCSLDILRATKLVQVSILLYGKHPWLKLSLVPKGKVKLALNINVHLRPESVRAVYPAVVGDQVCKAGLASQVTDNGVTTKLPCCEQGRHGQEYYGGEAIVQPEYRIVNMHILFFEVLLKSRKED